MSVKQEIQKRLDSRFYTDLPIEHGFKAIKADLELALSELPDRRPGRPRKEKVPAPDAPIAPEPPKKAEKPTSAPAEKKEETPVEAPESCPKCGSRDISLLSPGVWRCDNPKCRFKINPALQDQMAENIRRESTGEELLPSKADPNAVAKPESIGIGPPPRLTPNFGKYDPRRIKK